MSGQRRNAEYRRLADERLDIYRRTCRVPSDGRLSDAGRARKVAVLNDEILDLCGLIWFAELAPLEGPEDDYRLLCNELMRLLLAEQLFTFVTATPVETPRGETRPVPGTNNDAEQALRNPAMARDTGRTNKTLRGARRQTVLSSVLESLRQYLPRFTLSNVVEEVKRWLTSAFGGTSGVAGPATQGFNANGVAPHSPGLRSYLGFCRGRSLLYPNGVASRTASSETEPRWGTGLMRGRVPG